MGLRGCYSWAHGTPRSLACSGPASGLQTGAERSENEAPQSGPPQPDLGQSPRRPGLLPRALPLCSSDNHFVLPTLRMLVRQGVLGASPQLCTLDIPKGVGREANTQGSRGTSSSESMILARTAEPAGREVADPSETAGNGHRRQAPLAGREVTSGCDTGRAATVQRLPGSTVCGVSTV